MTDNPTPRAGQVWTGKDDRHKRAVLGVDHEADRVFYTVDVIVPRLRWATVSDFLERNDLPAPVWKTPGALVGRFGITETGLLGSYSVSELEARVAGFKAVVTCTVTPDLSTVKEL